MSRFPCLCGLLVGLCVMMTVLVCFAVVDVLSCFTFILLVFIFSNETLTKLTSVMMIMIVLLFCSTVINYTNNSVHYVCSCVIGSNK